MKRLLESIKITSVDNGYVIENLHTGVAAIAVSFPQLIEKLIEVFTENYHLEVVRA